MVDPSASPFNRSQRRQLALIPILSLVLAAILFWPENDPSTPSAVISQSETKFDSQTRIFDQPILAETTPPADRQWPQIPLAEILSFNPFALPSTLNNPPSVEHDHDKDNRQEPSEGPLATVANELQGVARINHLRQTLKQQRVSAIFNSDTGAAALIDSQVVRKGDLLSDGVRVLEIGPQGVVVRIEDDR